MLKVHVSQYLPLQGAGLWTGRRRWCACIPSRLPRRRGCSCPRRRLSWRRRPTSSWGSRCTGRGSRATGRTADSPWTRNPRNVSQEFKHTFQDDRQHKQEKQPVDTTHPQRVRKQHDEVLHLQHQRRVCAKWLQNRTSLSACLCHEVKHTIIGTRTARIRVGKTSEPSVSSARPRSWRAPCPTARRCRLCWRVRSSCWGCGPPPRRSWKIRSFSRITTCEVVQQSCNSFPKLCKYRWKLTQQYRGSISCSLQVSRTERNLVIVKTSQTSRRLRLNHGNNGHIRSPLQKKQTICKGSPKQSWSRN